MAVTQNRQKLGQRGEDHAANYLSSLGWEIIERNWRCREGELDIVAFDGEQTLVFVEVKTRTGLGFGTPLESITYKKTRTLMALAYRWLKSHDRRARNIRVDAIGILMIPGAEVELKHVQGIGTW